MTGDGVDNNDVGGIGLGYGRLRGVGYGGSKTGVCVGVRGGEQQIKLEKQQLGHGRIRAGARVTLSNVPALRQPSS